MTVQAAADRLAVSRWMIYRLIWDQQVKSADRRRWLTVGCEDSAVVTRCAHHGRGGIITVFVVVVPAKTLVP
jgi:hypothetical protein